MKKILIFSMLVLVLTGCGGKKVESNNDYNDDTQVYEEEQEQNGNNKTVPILLGYGSNDTIKITYDTDRFHVDDYYFEDPQEFVYFEDMTNGSQITLTVSDLGISTDEYYNQMVNKARKNADAEDFKASELEDVKYGGITFKTFNVSWSKPYEYNEKETGELVSGVIKKNESLLFAEVKDGVFLLYDGPIDENVFKALFIKIKK